MSFRKELEELINKHSRENAANTPDFILAGFLNDCLTAFDDAVLLRDDWYGTKLEPGQRTIPGNLTLREWVEAEIARKKEEQSNLTSFERQTEDRGQLSIEIRTLEKVLEKLPTKEPETVCQPQESPAG